MKRRDFLAAALAAGPAAAVAAGDEPKRPVDAPEPKRPDKAFIADIGTVLRLTPDDDLQIASGDGGYCFSDDRTPFYFQVCTFRDLIPAPRRSVRSRVAGGEEGERA